MIIMNTKGIFTKAVQILLVISSVLALMCLPAAAVYHNELPCDANSDDLIGEDELSDAICDIMLGSGDQSLDDVGDAAYIYTYWNGEPLTVTDHYGSREVTLYRPVERIALASTPSARIISSLGAADKVVGVYNSIKTDDNLIVTKAYPELKSATDISDGYGANVEAVIGLEPDVVFYSASSTAATLQDQTGVPVVALSATYGIDFNDDVGAYNVWRLAGEIVGEEERAEQLIEYSQAKMNTVSSISSTIPSDNISVAYIASGGDNAIIKCAPTYYALDIAGGVNPADGLPSSWGSAEVTKEQIIAWNPDAMFIRFYKTDQTLTKDAVMADSALATVSAVKDSKVYYIRGSSNGMDPAISISDSMRMAKLLYPDFFVNLDVEAEGDDIYNEFYGVDGLYTDMLNDFGVFESW